MREEVHYSHSNAIPGLTLSTAKFAAFRFEPHYHLDCHIALVADGVQRQTVRGAPFLLTRGSVQMVSPGEVHDGIAAPNESYTLHTFRLSPGLLSGLTQDVIGKHYFPSQAAAVLQDRAYADQLLSLHRAMQNPGLDPLNAQTQILYLFETLFARLNRPAPQRIAGTLTAIQLGRIREFVEAHCAEKISLEALALVAGLDRFRFLKQFKRTVGMTPHAWLLRLRLEKALALIKSDRQLSLTEISHSLGFFDQSHFTKAFREAYGVTPARF